MTGLALWTRRLWPYLAIGAVVWLSLTVLDVWRERRGTPEVQQARQATVYAERYVYRTDSLFQRDTVVLSRALTRYREVTDTVRLTDTVWVKAALAAADTTIRACTAAVSSCSVALAARDSLAARIRDELAIARRPAPRLAGRAVALYEPLTATPAASIEGTARVLGRLSLIARADQRFAVGERPRAYLGIAIAF